MTTYKVTFPPIDEPWIFRELHLHTFWVSLPQRNPHAIDVQIYIGHQLVNLFGFGMELATQAARDRAIITPQISKASVFDRFGIDVSAERAGAK